MFTYNAPPVCISLFYSAGMSQREFDIRIVISQKMCGQQKDSCFVLKNGVKLRKYPNVLVFWSEKAQADQVFSFF